MRFSQINMVEPRGGPFRWALVACILLGCLHTGSTLFDSVWVGEEEDDIGPPLYVDDDVDDEAATTDNLHKDHVVSELWQIFFPDSPSMFRSPLDLNQPNQAVGSDTEGLLDEENEHILSSTERRSGRDATPRDKRQRKNHGDVLADGRDQRYKTVPPKYTVKINLDIDWDGEASEDADLMKVKDAMSQILSIPENHVHVYRGQDGGSGLSLYFVKAEADPDSTNPDDLIPATDVVGALAAVGLKDLDAGISVDSVQAQAQEFPVVRSYQSSFWEEPYFAITLAAIAVVLMGIILLIVCCCVRKKESSEKPQFPTQESALLSPVPHQICLYPAAKPSVNSATAIQPEVSNIHSDVSQVLASKGILGNMGTPVRMPGTPLSGSGSGSPVYSSSSQSGTPIPGTPVHTPPLRIKARGLLERRGSNASLTLELGSGTSDSSHMGSPPKESTVEEYLLSAGHRMTRAQLRRCLDNVKALYGEFWEIPMNHQDKNIVPGSGMKNRYRTIIPNEATRVVLPEVDGDILTTYINANYIRGYAGEVRSFIATQGPMSNTVIDFWKMVWQEKSPIIVMITKLKEKNKNKCENYVPDYHDTFGSIEVQVEGISEKEGYIIRKLKLRHDGEEHSLLHYWYTAWPDHKAPNTARQLLILVKEVQSQQRDPSTGKVKGPVIVHCSAGIGRTGCFIGASIGLQQLREEHAVDVQSIVCTMRLDRGGMVQTNEQYEFVHQTLVLYEQELPEKIPSGD